MGKVVELRIKCVIIIVRCLYQCLVWKSTAGCNEDTEEGEINIKFPSLVYDDGKHDNVEFRQIL